MLEPSVRLRNSVMEGNLPITRRLLSRFPELWLNTDPSYKGWSNLHYASYHGHYLVCFYLISFINNHDKGIKNNFAQSDLLTFDRLTVLHLATFNNHSQTLHYLLQEFPGQIWLDFQGGSLSQTPLHFSSINGFKEGIKLFLEFGAKWTIQDSEGNTCLHYCFQYGHLECIQALFRFILIKYKSRKEAIAELKELESIKNNQGWTSVDLSLTFSLVDRYKSLKEEMFADDYDALGFKALAKLESDKSLAQINTPPINESTTGTSSPLGENKVLSSPIVPMSQAYGTPKERSDTNMSQHVEKQGRAHSSSLPSTIATKIRPQLARQRSQTANIESPYGIHEANEPAQYSPISPVFQFHKTPSLKSVTISPSTKVASSSESSLNSMHTITPHNSRSAAVPIESTTSDMSQEESQTNKITQEGIKNSPSVSPKQTSHYTVKVPTSRAQSHSDSSPHEETLHEDYAVAAAIAASNISTHSASPYRDQDRNSFRVFSSQSISKSRSPVTSTRSSFNSSRRPSISNNSSFRRTHELSKQTSQVFNSEQMAHPCSPSDSDKSSEEHSKKSDVNSISFTSIR